MKKIAKHLYMFQVFKICDSFSNYISVLLDVILAIKVEFHFIEEESVTIYSTFDEILGILLCGVYR